MFLQQESFARKACSLANRVLRLGLVAYFAMMLFGSVFAAQAQQVNTTQGLTAAGAPLAIHGYDPVAYFTENRARIGKAAFSVAYQGAAYRFVSQANKETFEKDPERFVPQYGGFCAFGVAVGAKFDGDPLLFRIVDNKLYLNLSPDIQAKWQQDIKGNIAKADKNWESIRDKQPSALK